MNLFKLLIAVVTLAIAGCVSPHGGSIPTTASSTPSSLTASFPTNAAIHAGPHAQQRNIRPELLHSVSPNFAGGEQMARLPAVPAHSDSMGTREVLAGPTTPRAARPKPVIPAAHNSSRGHLPFAVTQAVEEQESADRGNSLRAQPLAAPQPMPEQLSAGARSTVFSLEELTGLTEANNPKLGSALAAVESAKGDRVQAGLYPNPRFETNNPEIWAGRDSQLNFGFQQDWIVKGKIRLDKAAADQQVRVTTAKYVLERMRVLTNVRTEYFQTVTAREKLQNAERVLAISRTARDAAQELFDGGERAVTDVLLLKTEFERANVAYENIQTKFQSQLKQLAAATGIRDLVIQDVQGSLSDRPPYYDEPYIREFLQSRSSHMEMSQAEVTRRQILLHRAEVEPYPNFRFGPAFAANTTTGSDRQFWFSVLFDIPVWNLNQGNIRQARAELTGAEADMENLRNRLVGELAEMHARHKISQVLLARIEKSILPNAEQTQRLVQEGYTKGQLDVNRLLEAQRALLETKRDQIEAFEEAWTTASELAGYLQFEQFP